MEFDCALVDAEIRGNLFIEFSEEHATQDFALTIGQVVEALTQRPHPVALGTLCRIIRQRASHGVDQLGPGGAFREEILGATPHGQHGGGNVPVTRQKDRGEGAVGVAQGLLECHPTHARHLKVKDHAPGLPGLQMTQKALRRVEPGHLEA